MTDKEGKKKNKFIPVWLLSAAALLGLDQWTKQMASASLAGEADFIIIPGALQLHYLENRGAAFGMFHGKQIIFIVIACVVVATIGYFLRRIPAERKYLPLQICASLITAGALGNMFDRIVRGYVTDFIYVSLIQFPVFNLADVYICVGIGLLIILLMFIYKDLDL